MKDKRKTKVWHHRKRVIVRSAAYLKTVQIAERAGWKEPGTFGPASECTIIAPQTGNPRGEM